MINLFKALLELKYLKDQLVVYDKLMPYQDNISQKAEIDYANGNISEMDLPISNLKKEKFKNVMIKLGHDIKLKKEQINIDFNIPEDVIDNIELHDFLSCKSATSVSLLKKKYIEKDKEIKMELLADEPTASLDKKNKYNVIVCVFLFTIFFHYL